MLERIRPFVDHVHGLVSERSLTAIGARFDSFDAVSEVEVANPLAAARESTRRRPTSVEHSVGAR